MYVIGAQALLDFAAKRPEAGPDLRALAARLSAGSWPDAEALAGALGEAASAEGADVRVRMEWCGAEVRLAYDPAAEIVLVRSVRPIANDGSGDGSDED
jgi:mRNA-degrading endonuclease HigB of HigAB toxin-antitoxin module